MLAELIHVDFRRESDTTHYYVMNQEGDEICLCNAAEAARNICRILSNDWPNRSFTVEDDSGTVVFTA